MRKAAFVVIVAFLSATACSAESIQWYNSFQKALKDAQRDSKPIFVDIYADWCTWCLKLDRDVYSTPQFAKYMQGFIPVRLNAEDEKEGTDFVDRYQVDGFPTLIITDPRGTVTNRIGGYMDANALIRDMDGIQQLLKREKAHPDDVLTSFELAQEYLDRQMYSDAEARFKKVLNSDKATPDQKEESQFSVALSQYYQRELQPALDSLNTYRVTYPDGDSEEDALLLLSQLYIETDENAKAQDVLRDYLQKFPESDNNSRVQEVLEQLDADQ